MADSSPTIVNRKAGHLYHIEERFEVGLALKGSEVKSIRSGNISLNEAWIDLSDNGELWLVGAHIDEFKQASVFNHVPAQRRKLLAHRHEILKMKKAKELKGYTLIPIKIYFKNRLAKMEMGICRGKDNRDRRQDLIAKESKKEVARIVKHRERE